MPFKRQYAVGRCMPRKRKARSAAASAYLRTYETYALKEAGGGTQMHSHAQMQSRCMCRCMPRRAPSSALPTRSYLIYY